MPKRNRNHKRRVQMNIPGSSNGGPSTSQNTNTFTPNPNNVTMGVQSIFAGAQGQQGHGRRAAAGSILSLANLQSRNDGLGHYYFSAADLQYIPSRPRELRTSESPSVLPGSVSSNIAEALRTSFLHTERFSQAHTPGSSRPRSNTTIPSVSNRNSNTNGSNTNNADTGGRNSSQTNTFNNWPQGVPSGPSAQRAPPTGPRNTSRTTWPNLNGGSNKENTPSSSGSGTESTFRFPTFPHQPANWAPGSNNFRVSGYPRLIGANSGWEPGSQSQPIARDAPVHYRPDPIRRVSTEGASSSNLVPPTLPGQASRHDWIQCQYPGAAGSRNSQPASSSASGQASSASAVGQMTGPATTSQVPDQQPANLLDNQAAMSYEYETVATVTRLRGSGMVQQSSVGTQLSEENAWAPNPLLGGFNTALVSYTRPISVSDDDEFEAIPPRSAQAPETPDLIELDSAEFNQQRAIASSVPPPAPSVNNRNIEASPRENLNLRELAEEASVLLEVYSRTASGENEAENHDMIKVIFENVSKIWDKYKPKGIEEPVVEGKGKQKAVASTTIDDSCVIDAGCIVCCAQVADVVLMPCNHLILCTDCCDVMRIQKNNVFLGTSEKKSCPLCRATVHDRIKVFRG